VLRKLNMNWHHPDLYFFLFLLAGLTTFLAIIYEYIQKFRSRKPPVVEPRRSNEKAVDPPSPPKHPPSPRKYLENVKPLDGLQRDRPRPTEERHVMEEIDESSRQAGKQAAERFSRLCESIKDLSPKEQASRLREYFGIVGGARPAEGRGRKGKGGPGASWSGG
jgi:hypothetical protein